jgi:hypothetical protein
MPVRECREPDTAAPTPLDRTDRAGPEGCGDMPGGLNAGADERLGLETDDGREFEPGSISGRQHDLGDAEPRTDAAMTYHGPNQQS